MARSAYEAYEICSILETFNNYVNILSRIFFLFCRSFEGLRLIISDTSRVQINEINKLFYRLAKEDDIFDDSSLSHDPCLMLVWLSRKFSKDDPRSRNPFTFVLYCIKKKV